MKYIKCGPIKFSSNYIEIGNEIYDIDIIEDINIVLYGYKGQLSYTKSLNSKIQFLRDGGNNRISFKYENKKLSFNFIVNYKFDNEELTSIIELWNEHFPGKVNGRKF